MSPELETLDQLQGGDLSLELVAKLFPSFDDFRRGVQGMLSSGDVVLTAQDGSEVPKWQWQELFRNQRVPGSVTQLRLRLTRQGSQRIG